MFFHFLGFEKQVAYYSTHLHKYTELQNRYNVLQHKSDFAGFILFSCINWAKSQKNTPSFVKKDGVKNFLMLFLPKKGIKASLRLSFLRLFPQGRSPFRGNLRRERNAKLLSS